MPNAAAKKRIRPVRPVGRAIKVHPRFAEWVRKVRVAYSHASGRHITGTEVTLLVLSALPSADKADVIFPRVQPLLPADPLALAGGDEDEDED